MKFIEIEFISQKHVYQFVRKFNEKFQISSLQLSSNSLFVKDDYFQKNKLMNIIIIQ